MITVRVASSIPALLCRCVFGPHYLVACHQQCVCVGVCECVCVLWPNTHTLNVLRRALGFIQVQTINQEQLKGTDKTCYLYMKQEI